MSVSVRMRFEVFKRDGFTCQYCGRMTPEVVLEVDHIVPRAEGGSDEFYNLITACWDCNHGKADVSLGDKAPVPDLTEAIETLREREEQIRAYEDARREERERIAQDLEELYEFWLGLGRTRHLPDESALRYWLTLFTRSQLMDAMRIAQGRGRQGYVRYFIGILRKWRNDADG